MRPSWRLAIGSTLIAFEDRSFSADPNQSEIVVYDLQACDQPRWERLRALAHPLLGPRRDRRIRFSGSWSVRLAAGGRHSNHVHPQGWISSALYLDLPDIAGDEPADAGWLVLGEPDTTLGVKLPSHSKIEPRVGQLVLFPSWMWHGTRPFAEGERLTVAFDVAPPK